MMNAESERRNYWLFLAGKLVSQSGSALYTFAAGWYVLGLTGSGASFGLTLALGILPMVLVLPLAGILADRVNRKRMVVGMDLLNGVWFLGMGLYASAFGLSVGAVYLTAVLTTVLTTLFSVSLEASKLSLVSEDRLMGLTAASRVVESGVAVAGPVLGGLMYGWMGMEAFLWVNGGAFLLSALTETRMRFHGASLSGGAALGGLWQNFKVGLAAAGSDPGLRSLAGRLMAINFVIGFCVTVPVPYLIHLTVPDGAKVLGLVQGATPVGVILGAVMISRLKWGVERAMKGAGALLTVSLIWMGALLGLMEWQRLMAVAGSLVAFAWLGLIPGMLFLGVGIAWIDLPLMAYFQLAVPEAFKGRVLSVIMSLAKLALPAALLMAGQLMGRVPTGLLTVSGGFFYLGSLLLGRGRKCVTPRKSFSLSYPRPPRHSVR